MAKEGRPLKFGTVEELKNKIKEYFDSCFITEWIDEEVRDNEGEIVYVKADIGHGTQKAIRHAKVTKQVKPLTITGLAYSLGTSRRTLIDYEEKDEFSHTISEAKHFIEAKTEENIANGNIPASFGIFSLKNNYGWKDEVHNVMKDERLSPEEQAKMDLLLLKIPQENDKPGSIKAGNNGDKPTA